MDRLLFSVLLADGNLVRTQSKDLFAHHNTTLRKRSTAFFGNLLFEAKPTAILKKIEAR